jgi:cell division septation protein DedD
MTSPDEATAMGEGIAPEEEAKPEPVKVEEKPVPEKTEPAEEAIDRTPLRTKKENTEPVETNPDLALLEEQPQPGLQPKPPPTEPHDFEQHDSNGGDWFIQVGAFGNQENAHKLAARLRSAGYPVVLVPLETETSSLLQVRVGGYASRDDGKSVSADLKKDFDVPTVLVSK